MSRLAGWIVLGGPNDHLSSHTLLAPLPPTAHLPVTLLLPLRSTYDTRAIHVRHQNSGFWWRAADGKTWSGSVATSSDFDQPDVSQALTVIRVSATTIKLQTPSSTFLCKAPPSPPNASYPRGILTTTADATDPLATFTIIPIPNSRRDTTFSADAAASAGTAAAVATCAAGDSTPSFSPPFPPPHHQIKLQTPSSTFLCKAPPSPPNASYPRGILTTTADATDPLATFTIIPIPNSRRDNTFSIDAAAGTGVNAGAGGDEWLDVREVMTVPAIRGVNLGGWLVGEEWMNPKTFQYMAWGDGTRVSELTMCEVPQKLYTVWGDGTQVTFQSTPTDMYSSAVSTGREPNCLFIRTLSLPPIPCPRAHLPGDIPVTFQSTTTDMYISAVSMGADAKLECNAAAVTMLQYFQLLTVPGAAENVRQVVGQMGQYWGVYTGATTVWTRDNEAQGSNNSFTLLLLGAQLTRDIPMNDSLRVMIQAPNGQLLQAHEDGTLTADYSSNATNETLWSGPAVFFMDLVSTVHGDWQAAYTAGPDQASTLFDSVHSKLITELDWQDMKARGVNTVYWAFEMAAKYGLRVWLSVHVAPGSQNGAAFSRDGLIRWSGLNVDHTLDFVRWIGDRFGGNPSLFGVGLLHEPVAPSYYGVLGVDGDELREYYRKAHDLIRERCACCFVSIEGRVGKSMWDVAFHMLDTWHPNVLYETHLYNMLAGIPMATRKLPQLVELEIGEERSNRPTLLDSAQSVSVAVLVVSGSQLTLASLTAVPLLPPTPPNSPLLPHSIPPSPSTPPPPCPSSPHLNPANRPTHSDFLSRLKNKPTLRPPLTLQTGRPILVGEFGVAMASLGATEEQQKDFTLAQMQALGHATHAPVRLFIIGRPILVGEFGVAMASKGATEEQQKQFTLAQMQALGHAQAGWFFWSWKLNVT
ncbi:unnamed protein product, partial [Closterium sp. Naga37s-1]